MAKLVIFGTGPTATLAHFYFTTDSEHEVVAFAVDRHFRQGDTFEGLPLCDVDDVAHRFPPNEHAAFVAVGYAKMNRVRAEKCAVMRAAGYELTTYVSSRCTYLAQTPPGENCFILEDNTVQPFVTIGNDVTLWSGNHIGHGSVLSDHCFVSSHVVVAGHVHVGEGCFLGANATIRDAVTLGPATLVGAGALIMKSTRSGSVYLGERSRPFPKTSDQIDL